MYTFLLPGNKYLFVSSFTFYVILLAVEVLSSRYVHDGFLQSSARDAVNCSNPGTVLLPDFTKFFWESDRDEIIEILLSGEVCCVDKLCVTAGSSPTIKYVLIVELRA